MSDLGSDAGEAFRSAGHATEGAVSGLKKPAGGIPKWAWALIIVGGGITVYVLYTKYSASASAATSTGLLGGATSTDGSGSSGDSATTAASTGFSNNAAWENAAVSEFAGQYTPVQVQQALGDLQAGNPLTSAEQAIVNNVESALGTAPESTPTPVLASTPPAASTSSAAQYTTIGATVNSLYEALLGRSLSASAANTGDAAQKLASGQTQAQVAQWIKDSTEYKQKHPTTTAPTTAKSGTPAKGA